jgi:agmatine deiminase
LSGAGEKLEVDVIPVLPFEETDSGRVVVPYLNFYVGNNFVVIPVTGHEADNDMVQMIGEFFPGRDTVPLEIGRILAVGGGGIHCITQQVPA